MTMRRWVIVLVVAFLFCGYYLFQNISKNQSSQQKSNSEISKTSKIQPDKTIFEEKTQDALIPEGQETFFGTVINVRDTVLTVQPNRTTKAFTVKLDKTTIYSGGKQSDITKDVRIAGIGKRDKEGNLTATKLEIKHILPTK